MEQVVNAVPVLGKRLGIQGNVAVIAAGKTTGLALGRVSAAPLSLQSRLILFGILIGAIILIVGGGLVFARRRQAREQGTKNAEK